MEKNKIEDYKIKELKKLLKEAKLIEKEAKKNTIRLTLLGEKVKKLLSKLKK